MGMYLIKTKAGGKKLSIETGDTPEQAFERLVEWSKYSRGIGSVTITCDHPIGVTNVSNGYGIYRQSERKSFDSTRIIHPYSTFKYCPDCGEKLPDIPHIKPQNKISVFGLAG